MSTFGESLVAQFFERVHGFVRMRVPAQDCDDVVAEIFLRAIQRQNQLRGEAAPWLFTIARTQVAEFYRSRGTVMQTQIDEERTDIPAPPVEGNSALEKLERAEFGQILQRKMSRLSELERDVIALKFTDGLSNREIADILNITPNNLGVVLHRALRRLREAMLEEVKHVVS